LLGKQDVRAAKATFDPKVFLATRPRVNSFMNKFRKLGFIEYNGTVKVHSALLSVILHD
jgi:hypothetical protein